MIRLGVGCLLGFLIIDITVVGGRSTGVTPPWSCHSVRPRTGDDKMARWIWESERVSDWLCVRCELACPACCNSISAALIEAVVVAGPRLDPPACMAPADTTITRPAQANMRTCHSLLSSVSDVLTSCPHLVLSWPCLLYCLVVRAVVTLPCQSGHQSSVLASSLCPVSAQSHQWFSYTAKASHTLSLAAPQST